MASPLVRYRAAVPTPRWLILPARLAAVACLLGGTMVLATRPSGLVTGVILLAAAVFWIGLSLVFDHLRITVGERDLRFAFGPLGKTIPLADLVGVEVQRYPWLAFGGWGIRYSTRGRRAYSVPTYPTGLLLRLRSGRSYHISCVEPEELRSILLESLPESES